MSAPTTPGFAEVAVAAPVDQPFTYRIPPGMSLVVGHAVLVPFGRRRVTGYVVGLLDHTDVPAARMKDIARLLDPKPAIGPNQLALCRWASEYYLSGLGEVIATALPSSYRGGSRRVYLSSEAGVEAVAAGGMDDTLRMSVLREVVARSGRTRTGIERGLRTEAEPQAISRALDALVRDRLVMTEQRDSGGPKGMKQVARLTVSADDVSLLTRGVRMRAVLAALVEAGGAAPVHDLVDRVGASARSAIHRLAARNLVELVEEEDRRAVDDLGLADSTGAPPNPNPDQQAALDAIAETDKGAVLIHGVTGSGKTEVYLQAARRVLDGGRQVLVLVPEIALTPQLLGRFRSRFGQKVAVLHSGLAAGERLREWRRIRAGDATVAVGARSALFAPFQDLGLVIVDEEHDDSYKQDDGVRYHARDLAVVRGHLSHCPVVLGSATPSLETWANALHGRYRRVEMPRRATPRAVPTVELVDLRGQPAQQVLSPILSSALTDTLSSGGQAIVLFNRRGFAPVVECPGCGAHYTCPSCGIGMVLHKKRGRVACHYCGFHRPYDPRCQTCGDTFAELGFGTERVVEALEESLPGVAIGRMDADTTAVKGAHARILETFRSGATRVLVGTQLVAKGHDFPNVQLAGVVGVDNILSLPDFRSAERTFSLVTQLAGRAGRGANAGRVIVQTRQPEHFVFRELQREPGTDLDAFFREEARQRQILGQPPSTRLVLLRVEGAKRQTAWDAARDRAAQLRGLVGPGKGIQQVLGPTAAPMSRLVGRWRFQIILRGHDPRAIRAWLRTHRSTLMASGRKGVRVIVDVDPRSLL
ncbi:MAG: primosomal protein N' [Deltaproteobacteria bacterium]|nr:primosomal protein N' [Deltaproteobacteria bacterium]HCH66378.1 primosomal protein N' [Deltaproteobacteria bacterium]